MGCIIAVLAAIVPRVLILAGWLSDPRSWNTAFPSPVILLLGWILVPWTTFFFALFVPGGFSPVQVLILIVALIADIATWSGGLFGKRGLTPGYADD